MVSFDKNKRVKEKMRRQRVIYKMRKQQMVNQTVWAEYLKLASVNWSDSVFAISTKHEVQG